MSHLIYVADDEENIRNLVQSFLVNAGFRVQTFASGDELLATFRNHPADLVILDIMMPGTDGLTLCSHLRQRSAIPIIIVSARDSELDRITGITLGSDDYLIKPFSPVELVARVRALFRRMELDNSSGQTWLLSAGNLQIDTQTRVVTCSGEVLSLTPTEFTLLCYFLSNQDKAISRDELLQEVWQFDFVTDTRATDDLIKRLRKKLSAAGCTILIESVWGFGFRLSIGKNT
ncbi:MAG: response regulator transcription factor [Bacillota bacterium]|nr:response regulator transcription factor [Bacillota bacterium]